MNENMSFDRMRNMLTRAAEIRESEQQQIFDALDEIHARMSPLESLGSVRKRLSELPDRTELGVLTERVDEALTKIDAQDGVIGDVKAAVEGLFDKLAKPFAQLDGRLDGVSGRFDGVAGRMDGLEDKLAHIHKRLDELGGHLDKQDSRLEALPGSVTGPVRERIDGLETSLRGRFAEIDEGVHEHLDGTRETLQRAVTETGSGVQNAVTEAVTGGRDQLQTGIDALAQRPAVDPTDKLDKLAERLEQLTERLDRVSGRLDNVEDNVHTRIEAVEQGVSTRLDTVEEGVKTGLGELGGTLAQNLSQISGTLASRPDSDAVNSMVREASEETERKHAGQLDEAMATFAELILGGSGPSSPPPPTTLPRQQRGRGRSKSAKRDGDTKALGSDDSSDEGYAAESA
ncbi:apolipoprotein A1/A4/E family protein [Saccharopolyspora gregorii]|uniref:PA containing protein n=1 Tax=Saccharopolyspora gregorii TaxID=33914 RepID=A0ABP6RXL0_9PSEU|nr:apolipoprotein A1/A4/E family protein [Saccharopolyspora gregorii]